MNKQQKKTNQGPDEKGAQMSREDKDVFRNVMFATAALEFGLGLQRGIFNNFVVEVVGINPAELGFCLLYTSRCV